MTRLSVTVRGDLVRQGLEDFSAELPRIGKRRIRTIMNRIVRREQAYPAERPGQTYVRTGRLFSHWEIKGIDAGYMIENRAAFRGREYAGYVVGDAYGTGQAWMHKGRWETLRDVSEDELKALSEEIEDEIVMVARRVGL
jgi:hypothetical protein